MAKSPAFSFYSADFEIGTKFFTDDEVGKYTRLICTQHQTGHMTLEEMEMVCKGPVPLKVMKKYVQDEEGKYYNVRLDNVINKKKAYVEKLQKNLGKYYGKSKEEIEKMKAEEREKAEFPEKEASEAPSTSGESKNQKVPREPAGRFKPPSVEEVTAYCKERNNAVDPFDFVNHYAAKGWRIGKEPMKDWKACVHTWENKAKKESSVIDRGQHPGQIIVSGKIPAKYKTD